MLHIAYYHRSQNLSLRHNSDWLIQGRKFEICLSSQLYAKIQVIVSTIFGDFRQRRNETLFVVTTKIITKFWMD